MQVGTWACIKRFELPTIEANGYAVNSASLHPERKVSLLRARRAANAAADALLCCCWNTPSPLAQAFVAAGGNFWVYVHDYETGEELQCNKGHHGPVYGMRFTPDGSTYASAGDDGTIRLWPFGEGAERETGGEGEGEAGATTSATPPPEPAAGGE